MSVNFKMSLWCHRFDQKDILKLTDLLANYSYCWLEPKLKFFWDSATFSDLFSIQHVTKWVLFYHFLVSKMISNLWQTGKSEKSTVILNSTVIVQAHISRFKPYL